MKRKQEILLAWHVTTSPYWAYFHRERHLGFSGASRDQTFYNVFFSLLVVFVSFLQDLDAPRVVLPHVFGLHNARAIKVVKDLPVQLDHTDLRGMNDNILDTQRPVPDRDHPEDNTLRLRLQLLRLNVVNLTGTLTFLSR